MAIIIYLTHHNCSCSSFLPLHLSVTREGFATAILLFEGVCYQGVTCRERGEILFQGKRRCGSLPVAMLHEDRTSAEGGRDNGDRIDSGRYIQHLSWLGHL